MKTIILCYEENDRPKVLEQVMRGALSFGFVITKYVKVFSTKKEAQETIKNHVCKIKKAKYVTLNKKQINALKYLETKKGYFYINDFVNLKK